MANHPVVCAAAIVAGLLLTACKPPEKAAGPNPRVADEEPAVAASSARPSDDAPSVDNDLRTQENATGQVKIVGGTLVGAGLYRDTVGVARAGSTNLSCTGTLIEPDVVLTAAHCACPGISGRVFVGESLAAGGTFYAVKRSVHGLSSCTEPLPIKRELDLAVLLLDRPVPGVTPRRMADDALLARARSYRAVGFGAIDRDARVNPREKRTAEIVGTSRDCRGRVGNQSDEYVYGCEPGREIVAGQLRGRTDTCNGDSGGPLLVSPAGDSRANPGDYLLAGATSRATSQSQVMCGDGGVYERIDANARAWINAKVQALRAAP